VDEVVKLDEEYAELARAAEATKAAAAEKAEAEEQAKDGDASPPDEPDPEGIAFGPGGKAWMTVEVAGDKQQATLTAVAFGGEAIDSKAFRAALEEHFEVSHGHDAGVIEALVESARIESVVRGSHVVARGTPGEPGQDGRISIEFLPATEETVTLSYAELREALAQKELDAVVADDLLSVLVRPGEVLALVEPSTEGEPAVDVLGNSTPRAGQEVSLEAGDNVEASDEGYVSTIHGYACVLRDTISVLPPIWVSGDMQEAHFVHFPQAREEEPPQAEWLLQALQLKEVTSGVDEESVGRVCAGCLAATDKGSVCVARGKPPVPGQNTHIEYSFDPEKRAGKVLPDGSIDYRERNAVVGVAEDQFLGEVVAATKGQPGLDLRGLEVATKDVEEKTFSAGANVRCQSEGEGQKFYAEIDGAVNVTGDAVEVQPMYTVSGDVDYETGNVDVPMNLEIGGSVRAGFSVKSGASVVIGGAIEPGAAVQAKGDVVAAKGIFGEATKVAAVGNVETKFIQNSTVMARGNITAGAYMINAHVRAGGDVTIEEGGGPRGGTIVGGEVIAAGTIKAKLIGSVASDRTVVGIGPTMDQMEQGAKIRRDLQRSQAEAAAVVKELGLRSADPDEIEILLQRTPAQERGPMEGAAGKLREADAAVEEAQKAQAELDEQIAASLAESRIQATTTVFADVQVRFGGEASRVAEDVKSPEFYIGEEGIRWRAL